MWAEFVKSSEKRLFLEVLAPLCIGLFFGVPLLSFSLKQCLGLPFKLFCELLLDCVKKFAVKKVRRCEAKNFYETLHGETGLAYFETTSIFAYVFRATGIAVSRLFKRILKF